MPSPASTPQSRAAEARKNEFEARVSSMMCGAPRSQTMPGKPRPSGKRISRLTLPNVDKVP
jgi:hypothetical protein